MIISYVQDGMIQVMYNVWFFYSLLSSNWYRMMISVWNKHVINDMYNSIGGTDVSLCDVGYIVQSHTASTFKSFKNRIM